MVGATKGTDEYGPNIQSAVSYLVGKYDSHVGLLYESEDNGTHWLGPWATYRHTYWLYSDNLEAMHALAKFSPAIAENISRTYNTLEFPKKTLLFGTLFGEDIPDKIKHPQNVAIVNNSEAVLIYRRHDGRPFHSFNQWSDMLCYRALDEYQFGNKTKANAILQEALGHWDGKGFNDDSTKKDGYYANYKMGLFLYTADKMKYPLQENIRGDIERQMWRQQNNQTGGITSLADLSGNPIGSANIETTSLTLLPYAQ